MAVNDHGIEALKKAALEVTPGDRSNYQFQVKVLDMPAVTIDTSLLATAAKQDQIIALLTTISATLTTIANNTTQPITVVTS